jgi:general stress protein YciG
VEQEVVAGTKEGGRKAAAKNLARDPDFYKNIGRKGGKKGTTGGFAANRELASIAGTKGGTRSRRTKARIDPTKEVTQ